jgi:hypothetical protein
MLTHNYRLPLRKLHGSGNFGHVDSVRRMAIPPILLCHCSRAAPCSETLGHHQRTVPFPYLRIGTGRYFALSAKPALSLSAAGLKKEIKKEVKKTSPEKGSASRSRFFSLVCCILVKNPERDPPLESRSRLQVCQVLRVSRVCKLHSRFEMKTPPAGGLPSFLESLDQYQVTHKEHFDGAGAV